MDCQEAELRFDAVHRLIDRPASPISAYALAYIAIRPTIVEALIAGSKHFQMQICYSNILTITAGSGRFQI
jgi:hypothetical protein